MLSLFKFMGNWIDRSEDQSVEKFQGKVYHSAIGALGWVLLCLIVGVLFIGLTWWRGSIFKPVEYLSVAASQPPQPLSTLVTPVYSGSRIQNWVSNVVAETLTFNFINVEDRMALASSFYSPDAAAAMQASIEARHVVRDVKAKRLDVTVTPLFTPRITEFMVENGVNTWIVEAPILLTYTSASDTRSQSLRVLLQVRQVNPALTPDGLIITGFITSSFNF